MSIWDVLPTVADVAYTSVALKGNFTFTLPRVITSPRKRIEGAPSDGVYRKWLTTFKIEREIWGDAALGPRSPIYPKLRDTLVVGDNTWTVFKDVDAPSDMEPRGPWRLCCIHLEIQPDIARQITWKLPTDTTDAYASPLTDQTKIVPAANCAIQEQSCEEVMFQGRVQGMRRTYSIWVLDEPRFEIGTIGTDDRGYTYTVTGINSRNRLDELVEVEARIDP